MDCKVENCETIAALPIPNKAHGKPRGALPNNTALLPRRRDGLRKPTTETWQQQSSDGLVSVRLEALKARIYESQQRMQVR